MWEICEEKILYAAYVDYNYPQIVYKFVENFIWFNIKNKENTLNPGIFRMCICCVQPMEKPFGSHDLSTAVREKLLTTV